MFKVDRQWNWGIHTEVARALQVLSATERYVLTNRFRLSALTANGDVDPVDPLSLSGTIAVEQRGLRKLRSAALRRSSLRLYNQTTQDGLSPNGLGGASFSGQPDSRGEPWESWLGGSGTAWWDES